MMSPLAASLPVAMEESQAQHVVDFGVSKS